jgi:two-component sensor histidine kinase
MKAGSVLKKILISSWFLAIIPAILFIIFIPPYGSKYSLSVESINKVFPQYFYADLNSDTVSEVVFSAKGLPYFFIAVKNNNNQIYDQWNLADSLDPNLSEIFLGNYDHDRYKEIYVFTYKRDSLFLNVNEMLESSGTRLEKLFITKIGFINGQPVAVLKPAGFFDENGDGKDELYFSISSGFRLGPRKLYYFDIVNKRLNSSQLTGSITLNPRMADPDNDLRPEIFGAMSASGNYRTNIPFSDSSTWLMVFNDSLNFEFPPVEFSGFGNSLEINTYSSGLTNGYILTHWAGGTDTTVPASRIMIYSPEGKLIRYRLLGDFCKSDNFTSFIIEHDQSDRIYIIGDKIFELNDGLEVVRTIKLPFSSPIVPFKYDINADGEQELLLYSEEAGKLAIYSAGLNKMTEHSIKTSDISWKFSHFYNKNHEHKLFMTSGNTGYFMSLTRNNYYYLGYFVHPGVYFLFFFFILLVRRINTRQVEQKESLKRRLVTLQLQGIKAQLDPHFTFNTLNSVASLIYLDDRKAAYDYMNKFTQLLRGMLNDAERVYRNLSEELEFTTIYLDLEKLRFGEKFNYKIEIGEGVNREYQVPKLVLHTFAENAIKHGIMPKEDGGMLNIRIEKENDYLKLTIEDNGIGRERAGGESKSTGMGLKLTWEFYDILNKISKKPIRHLITDLSSESGYPSGTRVEVWVPVEEEENKREKIQ